MSLSYHNGILTTYEYGSDGLRTQKTYGSTTYNYYYADGQLIRQTWGTHYIDFLYDETGSVYSIINDGTQYYFVKNLQGDVVQIRSVYGTVVVEYTYDAWGNVLSITGLYADTLGQNNPIRYRGYYQDFETGFYYLQSRYYDPAIRRFINADGYVNANGDFLGFNMYAYCGNHPVSRADDGGEFWHILVGAVVGVVGQYISDVVSNVISGKKGWDILKPTSSIVDYAAAAASGAVAATGIGAVGSAVANAAIDGTAYVANQLIEGEEIDENELTKTMFLGAVTSGKGINGKNLRGVYKQSTQVLKTAVSPKKIAMYTAKQSTIKKTVTKKIFASLGSDAGFSLLSNIFGR